MTTLTGVTSALGTTHELLAGVEPEQHPSYSTGNGLGWLPEHVIAGILRDASLGSMTGSAATGFRERFERLNYSVYDWIKVTGKEYGRQGRFEFELKAVQGTRYELRINVPWRLDRRGVSMSETEIVDGANLAIRTYWGALGPGREHFELVSRHDGMVIPIIPGVVLPPKTDSFVWNISVYPDSAQAVPHYEVVWMSDFSWAMRETLSFRPREDDPEKAGRGPHEVGHMMGIPHDIGDRYTIMSTVEGINHWRYSLGGDKFPVLRPYASHFKLAKVWAEMAFAAMDRLEDFIIRPPWDE